MAVGSPRLSLQAERWLSPGIWVSIRLNGKNKAVSPAGFSPFGCNELGWPAVRLQSLPLPSTPTMSAKNPVPPPLLETPDPGFTQLFDGTEQNADLFSRWLMAGPGGFARIERTLVAQPGDDIGLLYYAPEQFENFILRLDFLLPHPRGKDNDNSGVFVRFRDPRLPVPANYPPPDVPGNPATVGVDTGYEVQIDEEARGDARKDEPDGLFYNRTGAIYKIKELGCETGQQDYKNEQRLSAEQWHRYEIEVNGQSVIVRLNGAETTHFRRDPAEQFRGNPPSIDPTSGFIGLQSHTGSVAFANVAIRKL